MPTHQWHRSPRKTPHSQRRHKKSLRLAAGNDAISGDIPAINADIMQGNTDLGRSGDLDGDGSISLPSNIEDIFGNVSINIDCDANAAAFGSETADMYSALRLLGEALQQSNNTESDVDGSEFTTSNEVSNEHLAFPQAPRI